MKTYKRKKKLPLCKCGCGKKVSKLGNKYIRGHNAKKGNPDSPSNNGHFKKGNTHGKNGRPQGSRNRVTIAAENIFEAESGTIARQAVEMALSGHPQMIKLILERVVPIKKSSTIKLKGLPQVTDVKSAGNAAQFIFDSIVNGTVSPLDGEILSRVLDKRIHSLQITEIEEELNRLKEKMI